MEVFVPNNSEEFPKRNAFSIVPSYVILHPSLENGAKLLYGTISALSNGEEYECYASNSYLAKSHGVGERTIVNWLLSLKELGLIKIETIKNGMKWDRKIWICLDFKDISTKGKNFPDRRENPFPIEGKELSLDINSSYMNRNNINCDVGSTKSPPDNTSSSISQQSKKPSLTPSPEAEEASKRMFAKIQELNPKAKIPNLKEWGCDLDRMHRIDKREWSEITEMIDWIYDHDFWRKNVLCPATLRKQWDKLFMQKLEKPSTAKKTIKETNIDEARKLYVQLQEWGQTGDIKIFKDNIYCVPTKEYIYYEMNPAEFKNLICRNFNLVVSESCTKNELIQ